MSVQEIIDLLYMMAGEEIIGLREKTEDVSFVDRKIYPDYNM